jgi:NTP pyrophosphatase (non-canonical NTP hydrolase)
MLNPEPDTPRERERLLAELMPYELELVQEVMAACPRLTVKEIIAHLRAAGM